MNWTAFAMRLICIEKSQFCTKCMHIISFTYSICKKQKKYRDSISLAAQFGLHFHPLRMLCELHGFFLAYLCRFNVQKKQRNPFVDSSLRVLTFVSEAQQNKHFSIYLLILDADVRDEYKYRV